MPENAALNMKPTWHSLLRAVTIYSSEKNKRTKEVELNHSFQFVIIISLSSISSDMPKAAEQHMQRDQSGNVYISKYQNLNVFLTQGPSQVPPSSFH